MRSVVMSVDPIDEFLDEEIPLASAEDYAEGGTAAVYRQFFEGQMLSEEVIARMRPDDRDALILKPRKFSEPPARVGVWASATVNMGDFNSVKFGAVAVVPCYSAEKDDAFEYLKEWVTERVNGEIEEARRESGPRRPKPRARKAKW